MSKNLFLIFMLLMLAHSASAQERSRLARIGILRVDAKTSPVGKEAIDDLKRGLNSLGYLEQQNIQFEIRWAENRLDELPSIAVELVQLRLDAIVTGGPQAVKALKDATNTVPIVMGRMDDVVEHGLVASLARPGGNITGLSFQTGDLSGKWLELLKETVPKLSRTAVLWDASGTAGQLRTVEGAGRAIGLHLAVLKAHGLTNLFSLFDESKKIARKAYSFWPRPYSQHKEPD